MGKEIWAGDAACCAPGLALLIVDLVAAKAGRVAAVVKGVRRRTGGTLTATVDLRHIGLESGFHSTCASKSIPIGTPNLARFCFLTSTAEAKYLEALEVHGKDAGQAVQGVLH